MKLKEILAEGLAEKKRLLKVVENIAATVFGPDNIVADASAGEAPMEFEGLLRISLEVRKAAAKPTQIETFIKGLKRAGVAVTGQYKLSSGLTRGFIDLLVFATDFPEATRDEEIETMRAQGSSTAVDMWLEPVEREKRHEEAQTRRKNFKVVPGG